jgi:chromosome segregation ATPase
MKYLYSRVYRIGVTPNPVLCLMIARIANESQCEEELISFFKSMDKMLTAFNQDKSSKFLAGSDSFNFLKFSRAYGWQVDLYEKIGITKKENVNLKSTLRSKEMLLEQLAAEFEAEKKNNQILLSNSQSLQNEMSDLQKKYRANCEEISILNEYVKQKSLEKGIVKKDVESKKKEIEITSLKIKELNFKLSRSVTEKEAVNVKNLELNKELKIHQNNLKQNTIKIEELNKELQSLLFKITSHERENNRLNDDLKKISTEYEGLNNKFQTSIANASLLEKKLKESELKLMAQIKENGVLESNFSELKINYKALSEKCEQANKQIIITKRQIYN